MLTFFKLLSSATACACEYDVQILVVPPLKTCKQGIIDTNAISLFYTCDNCIWFCINDHKRSGMYVRVPFHIMSYDVIYFYLRVSSNLYLRMVSANIYLSSRFVCGSCSFVYDQHSFITPWSDCRFFFSSCICNISGNQCFARVCYLLKQRSVCYSVHFFDV